MKQPMLFSRLLLIAIFALPSFQLFAQTSTVVQLNGSKMRAPLEVANGESSIVLSGLAPGNTYLVIAARAAAGQVVSLELGASANTAKAAQAFSILENQKNAMRFTATTNQVEFTVKAQSKQSVSSVPMFLSVSCETCIDNQAGVKSQVAASLANLEVQNNVPAESLIKNTLIGGDCFAVNNVTSKGNALARGTFNNGGSNIGLGSGMVMSTGNINILPGPNTSAGANGGFNTLGSDANLSSLLSGGQLYDVNVIEFDFTPTANTVQFDFVFGSEEYCEYVGTEFLDVFGFFISGPGIPGVQNLAVIPGTGGIPVTTNNVNHLSNSVYYVNNNLNLFECLFSPANHLQECELDGWTTPLTALVSVVPCSTYHIKLAIADVTDGLWDSAVFLRANSFNAGGSVAATPAYNPGFNTAIEGCSPGAIRFSRANSDVSQPLTVNFTVSNASTAMAGVDYAPLSSPVIIPAGQTSILMPVTVFADGIMEGQETIKLLIDNSCQCQQSEVTYLIEDKAAFNAFIIQDTTLCEGAAATIIAVTDGGEAPFTYSWSTGETSPQILVTPTTTSTYSVTITDACGDTATDDVLIDVTPIVRDTAAIALCSGGSIEIGGVFYSVAGTVIDTSYEVFACGQITTYVITVLNPVRGSDIISFCPGASVVIGGITYNQPGIVVDTLSTASGCDSIVTHNLTFLPQPTRSETVSLCPGESVTIGGVVITAPGTFLDFIPGVTGCDTIVTYTIVLLPQPTRAQTIHFCPGTTVTLGGNSYTQPGTVMLTEPGGVGCDTIVTYTLAYNTPAPSNVSITCPDKISVNVGTGANGALANFANATASSDCICPGIDISQSAGLASGSTFPVGTSTVCYMAKDACGQTKTCCFTVSVSEENACDIKVIGCMKYELLTITQDQGKNKTYRIRVTNNCSSQLIYTAIQTPNGVVATYPLDNATYTAPSGNNYLVRSPNFSPFYSVRYRALGGGIANGQSDILRYRLPAQADVTYIDITSRLSIQQFYEAHLNTFYCPIGVTPVDEREDDTPVSLLQDLGSIFVFPNPTSDDINVDLSIWSGIKVHLQVFNSQGQRVLFQDTDATLEPQRVALPNGLADGLYFLEAATEAGEKEVVKFVVRH